MKVGALANGNAVTTLPLEVYVARVLAGEGELKAADAAQQALAVAIRTFALANVGRHARDGFDLCETTHCQVLRAATPVARRAALATAGQLLTYDGQPAEVFYSASCGGRSESVVAVWPEANYPYLRSVRDEVHDDDQPWTLELTLREIQAALGRAGFDGQRLRDVRVDARTASGRASRLRLPGLQPGVVGGEQFRAAIGTTELRSTAFSIQKRGNSLRFTGRGFGHGVGMCVIGAGRLASRGDDARAILGRYYPGLAVARIESVAGSLAEAAAPPAEVPVPRPAVIVRVPRPSPVTAGDIERLATQAHDDLSRTLGTSVAPVTIRLHESLDSFRLATGQPWWVGTVSEGTSIDLAPAAVLALRDGLEGAVRTAVAELLVSETLAGRAAWVRIGAARYFGSQTSRMPPVPAAGAPSLALPASAARNLRCPTDAELTLAISAAAQREAEARAGACFAREYARSGDWRTVR